MKRHISIVLATLGLALALCSSASAAVSLVFTEARHLEAEVYRGDGLLTYSLKLKNTGSTATTEATSLSLALPAGVKFGAAQGQNWTCHFGAEVCAYPAIPAGGESTSLKVEAWIYPERAPQRIDATFTAFGGGATMDAFAADSVTLLPEKPFELLDFGAGACAQPPAAPGPGTCSGVFGSTAYSASGNLGSTDFTQAGGHPFAATTTFSLPTRTTAHDAASQYQQLPVQYLRDLHVELPAGFIGNPEVVPPCRVDQVLDLACDSSSIVGGLNVDFGPGLEINRRPIYRVVPEAGYAAAFGFQPLDLSPLTVVLRAKLRSNGDYGVTAISPYPPALPAIFKLHHATLCGYGAETDGLSTGARFKRCLNAGEPGANPVPFITNPTTCAGQSPVTRMRVDSYQHPGALDDEGFADLSDPNWKTAEAVSPQGNGCEALTEAWTGVREPSFTFRPDSTRAAAAAAYTAHLHIPQDGLLEENGLASSHLKDTTVTLPGGVALNPSAADGLGACTPAQAGYLGNDFPPPNPIHFKTTAAGCPEDSKIGTVTVETPILEDPLPGSVYLAAQDDNPFGSRFAIYIVIDDHKTGVKVTLPGKVVPDEQTGQVTATFLNNPQAPVEDLTVDFFTGPRASLANPDVCGDYTTRTQLTPWSAQDPDAPTPAEIADPSDTVGIDTAPAGAASCATSKAARPFTPTFAARSTDPTAGANSPFTLRLTRGEGEQEFSGVSITTPPGFAATLKGIATCSDVAVSAATSKTGKAELANPSCPTSSQVGTTTIGAGAGPSPYYVKTGKVYLTGPYKGAPLSLSFVVPAVAGPFDLGVQVVRTALNINPRNAQVTAVSDPIPQILDGVPLQIRDIRVDLDRSQFALNPTNCEAMSISSVLIGSSGGQRSASTRFQVGGCERLGFKPGLKLKLDGPTKRAAYPRLTATLTARPGDANISRAAVTLPHSAFLAQEHIRTVCTRVQFAAHACPAGSVYGHATAVTPLLDQPLSGPVYLRSSSSKLPDLVVALRGPDSMPIEVELAGRTDSIHGGIRNTFDIVPDAPVSKFRLELLGGAKSLIVNSRDLCKGTQRATAVFHAQNGLQRNFRPVVRNDCGGKRRGAKAKGGEGGRRQPATLADLWQAF